MKNLSLLVVLMVIFLSNLAAAKAPATAKRKASAGPVVTHPLDPLTEPEIRQTLGILQKEGKIGASTLIPYLMLKEPPKAEVLTFESGRKFRREAFAEIYDKKSGRLFEATVDLRASKLASFEEIPGQQPSVMLSEFDAVPPIVRADPRFAQAMKSRGLNPADVVIDTWAFGSPDKEHSGSTRFLRAVAYYKGDAENFYARPIEGFTAIVNMTDRKVDQVIDSLESNPLPVPKQKSEFDNVASSRPPRRPLRISQPQGVDFSVQGHLVQWQNWRFRYAMHPREGLVIYQVSYNDRGTWRKVLYRASLSEMMVPYGHNDQHWTYRAAFDEGEYGIGRYSGSLAKGSDVPDNARLFDAVFVDDFGKPYTTKDAVGIWERDGGLLWKHFDMFSKKNVSRRGRDLVIGFITTISNYDYGFNWIFREDGSLELEVVLSGIMLAKGSTLSTMEGHDHSQPDLMFGHLVAPNVVAPHHQHFFNMRVDLDVDGTANSVVELNASAVPAGADNPAGNAFVMSETPLLKEKDAARDLNFQSQRKWKVFNSQSKTPELKYSRGFVLIPGDNSSHYLQATSPLVTRGGFVTHHVWFTQENDGEMYAAGPYPAQRAGSDGLPEWIKQNRSLENNDVVMWYTFAMTHAPRPEEWPVMPVHKTGFKLIPAGFFDRSPALDVR